MKAANKSLLTIQPTDWLTYFTFKLHNTPALSCALKLLPKPFTSEALRGEVEGKEEEEDDEGLRSTCLQSEQGGSGCNNSEL